jgi:nicotinamidase-related amidase
MENSALLLIDVQEDILGSLEPKQRKDIIDSTNKLIEKHPLVIFINECNTEGDICPEHTGGSDIHKDIDMSKLKAFYIFKKPSGSSNSAWCFHKEKEDILSDELYTTNLEKFLKKKKITDVYVYGVDYLNCLNNTMKQSYYSDIHVFKHE